MTQIPIVSGIYADASPDFRTSYPVNMVPVPKIQGISEGYLRNADGIVQTGTGPGATRGGIEWDGVCYRVMGTKLVSVSSDGTVTTIGDVGSGSHVSMAYSFSYLAIASGGNLFLYDKTTLTQVTDVDLGTAIDVVWVDGYFMTTDGENLVVTELNNPFSVGPLKYGSSEVDPDPIKCLVKLRNEIYAVNRYTIEVFTNVGGNNFPFSRINGAQVTRGTVGTHTATKFLDGVAFIGGGKGESIGVYLANGGGSTKISTREIDETLKRYTDAELANIYVETVTDVGHDILMIHTPGGTHCFDGPGSQALGQPIWYRLSSGVDFETEYSARYFVWCYGDWLVGNVRKPLVGKTDRSIASQWGEVVTWEFGTPIIYNEARGGIINEIEMVALTGSSVYGTSPKISAEYSGDGITWSQPKYINAGTRGQRAKPLKWLREGLFRDRRIYRFRGDSNAQISVARLEASIEGMAW